VRRTGEARPITARNTTTEERQFLNRNARWLSPSTLRAKWIHGTSEHEDRPGQTLATRDPNVIQAWAQARRAKPATVGRRSNDRPRTLRLDFPGYEGGRRLETVDWKDWLRTFQERDLVFLFQEHRRNGGDSNFFRLDSPKRERG
jgi:hypothetical protein